MSSDIVSLKDAASSIVQPNAVTEGLEGIEQGELNFRPPQIKIVQAQRGEDIAGRRDLFEGDLFDTATLEKIGDENKPVRLIFSALWHQFMEWEGKGEDAKVIRSTTNAAESWVTGRTRPTKNADGSWEAPPVSKYIRGLAIRPGSSLPCIVTFARTSLVCGEQIILASRAKGGPLWARAWDIRSKSAKNNKTGGVYYTFAAVPVAEEVPAVFMEQAKAFNEQYASLRKEVSVTEE